MLHDDASQHNVVVAGSGAGERVLWLDFSMSKISDEESGQTPWQQQQMMEKEEGTGCCYRERLGSFAFILENHGRSNIS